MAWGKSTKQRRAMNRRRASCRRRDFLRDVSAAIDRSERRLADLLPEVAFAPGGEFSILRCALDAKHYWGIA